MAASFVHVALLAGDGVSLVKSETRQDSSAIFDNETYCFTIARYSYTEIAVSLFVDIKDIDETSIYFLTIKYDVFDPRPALVANMI